MTATVKQSCIDTVRDTLDFKGRASRKQFWHWLVATMVLAIMMMIADVILFPQNIFGVGEDGASILLDEPKFIMSDLLNLVLLLPTLSLTTRRLHDVDRSGHWQWIYLTIIGVFVVYYWCFKAGNPNANKYGQAPLA